MKVNLSKIIALCLAAIILFIWLNKSGRSLGLPNQNATLDLTSGELFIDHHKAKAVRVEGWLQSAKYLIYTDALNLKPSYVEWMKSGEFQSQAEVIAERAPSLMKAIKASRQSLKYPISATSLENNNYVFLAWLQNGNLIVELHR